MGLDGATPAEAAGGVEGENKWRELIRKGVDCRKPCCTGGQDDLLPKD